MTDTAPDNFRIARHKAAYKRIFFNQRLRNQIKDGNFIVRAIAQKVQGNPLLEELYRATLDHGANRAYDNHIASMRTRAEDRIGETFWATGNELKDQIDFHKKLAAAGYPEYALREANSHQTANPKEVFQITAELVGIAAFYGNAEANAVLHNFETHASPEESAAQIKKGHLCAAALGNITSNDELGIRHYNQFYSETSMSPKTFERTYLLALWHLSCAVTGHDDYIPVRPTKQVQALMKSDMNTKELRARYPKIFKEAKQALKLAR